MPSGGARPGAGRPKGSVKKKHQITVADVGHAEYLPVEYMLALMRDERAEPNRRDAMAVQAAPYIHARLNAVSTATVSRDHGGDINITQIFAVPRGSVVDAKSGLVITPDGAAVTELPELRPYEGTPPLAAITDQSAPPAPIAEPLPIVEVADDGKVTQLNPYRRRDDDPADGAA
jgi:hypothetical protein